MRLITRSDFDGLVCAMLFKQLNMVDEMKFVHPKDVQDGLIEVTENDILANVPYVPGCGLWFDHHTSELERMGEKVDFKGETRVAPSAARVVYDYYGGREKFGDIDDIMAGVDKADSAQFSADDILNPKGWDLLSFIMDARTGLGRYRDYRISNYQLMEDLVDHCATMSIADIMELPDVQERVKRYFELDEKFRAMLTENTRVDGNVIVTDLRGYEGEIFPGNRFMVYALWPEANISIWAIDGRGKQNAVFACGHSIINRTSKTDIGNLMLKNGGGGHKAAGTCQVQYEKSDEVLQELIDTMKANG